MYFVISSCQDGVSIHTYEDKEALLKDIGTDAEGAMFAHDEIKGFMPQETNFEYWGDNTIIIKGKLVVPTPVKTVTEFDVD